MKHTDCDEARVWLTRDREDGGDAPVGIRFHLERCEDCAGLAARYQDGVRALAQASAARAPRLPRLQDVLAAARRAGRPERAWRRVGVMVGVVASAALALLVARPWEGAPGDAPAQPEPEARSASAEAAPAPWSPETWEAASITTDEAPRAIVDARVASLRVAPDSALTFAAWGPDEAELVLTRGSVTAEVVPRAGDQRFAIATPELVASVVGTSFTVSVLPGEGSRVVVSEGVVYVELARGGALTLAAGDAWLEPVAGEAAAVTPGAAVVVDAAAPSVADVVRAARRSLAEGDHAAAIARLTRLRPATDGERASVAALLGDALVVAGRLEAARDAYLEASRRARGAAAIGALVELAGVQARLGEGEAATATWRRALAADPAGPHAARALAALGDDEAVLARFPESREATAALVRLGRAHLDAGRWEAAAALLAPHVDSEDAGRAEAALVGLMRARLGQGRLAEVRVLIARYDARFPNGSRREAVERLRASAGP